VGVLALAYVLAAPGRNPNPWILWAGGPLDALKAQWVPMGLAAAAVMLQVMALGSRRSRVTQAAILEERERRILPFLLVTDLTDREIVFGRPVGRMAAGLADRPGRPAAGGLAAGGRDRRPAIPGRLRPVRDAGREHPSL